MQHQSGNHRPYKIRRKELASRGITVNAIAPGFIKTDMTDVLSDKVKENISASIPMGSMGTAEDVAKQPLFWHRTAHVILQDRYFV